MSIQPQDSSGRQASPAPQPDSFMTQSSFSTPNQRQADSCPGCGAPVQPGQAICVGCGTVLHSQPKQIRCRHCGQKGSSAYALCPHCGRTMAAAPSFWLTWGIPAALVLLFALVLLSRMEGGPLAWVEQQMGETMAVVENPILTPVQGESAAMADAGQPPQEVVTPPAGEEADNPLALLAPTATATATAEPTDTPQPSATPTASLTASPTVTASPTLTAVLTSVAITNTQTFTNTATSTATSTELETDRTYTVQAGDTAFSIANQFQVTVADLLKANQLAPVQALQLKPGTALEIPGGSPLVGLQATATATGTLTLAEPAPAQTVTLPPTATATPIAQPTQQTYTVVSGDIPGTIAQRFNISTEALLVANGLSINQARDLKVGQKLIIPVAGESLPLTATPTPTPGLQRYSVRSGDTIIAIATRNGISANLLLAANGMTPAQALTIRPGDELIIPPPDYVPPTPTATPTRRPTATPTATPTPTVAIRLDAPTLIDPAQGINVSCGSEQYMRWQAVNGLAPDDEYVLFLGYVNSAPDAAGSVAVVPLLEQRTGQRLNWQMDRAYCNLAPQTFGRRWRWYVQIFAGDTPVSPPSATWEFSWQ